MTADMPEAGTTASAGAARSAGNFDQAALAQAIVQARPILDRLEGQAVVVTDPTGHVLLWNAGAQAITGHSETHMLGRQVTDALCPADGPVHGEFTAALFAPVAQGRWLTRRDGSRFWASGFMALFPGGSDWPRGFLISFQDCTQARAAASRRDLLVQEMTHRLKNSYALVQSIAAQTARHAATPEAFVAALNARLVALARAQDELMGSGTDDVLLSRIVESILAPHRGMDEQVSLGGPAVLLRAGVVSPVGLALNELATNATKYGALSVPEGAVAVAWTEQPGADGARRIRLSWRERGGPAVCPPARRGFGSMLLERGTLPEVIITLDYHPKGLECIMDMPLSHAPQEGADQPDPIRHPDGRLNGSSMTQGENCW